MWRAALLVSCLIVFHGCATRPPKLMCVDSVSNRAKVEEVVRAALAAERASPNWEKARSVDFEYNAEYVTYVAYFDAPPVSYVIVSVDCGGAVLRDVHVPARGIEA